MSDALPWIVAGIAGGGLALNIIVQIRGGAWNAADRERSLVRDMSAKLDSKLDEVSKSNRDAVDKLRSETTANLAALNADVDLARRESQDQHEDTISKFGDTVAALRQKVNDDALHAERTFMKREDFNLWSKAQQDALSTLDRKVDDRFNRIETLLLNRSWPIGQQTP